MLSLAPGAVMGDGTGSSVSGGLLALESEVGLVNVPKTMEHHHRKSPFVVENHHKYGKIHHRHSGFSHE